MALVPLSYNAKSLFVRRSSTILTLVSIAATVAVLVGVLSLRRGFLALFSGTGRTDVAVFLRPGASSEGESAFDEERVDVLVKSRPEIATDADGRPLAAAELFLAVRMEREQGGETNVPLRGVQDATFAIRAGELAIVEGRRFTPGSDELVVGRGLVGRIRGCRVGEVVRLNTTWFEVVGVFDHRGSFASEVWGDVARLRPVLERRNYSRVVATLRDQSELSALAAALESDKQVPAVVLSEREYLARQTSQLSGLLLVLGTFLALVMGTAAVFTGTNTMLAALSARTHEIGVLLSLGFRPFAIFVAFELEAMLLGLCGGVLGCLFALPLNDVRTGTTNWNTFTEVAFAFQVTPAVLAQAALFAVALGLVGGAWPAWRAARLKPTAALRRG